MWDFIVYGAECEWRLFVRSLSFCTLSSKHILSSRFCVPYMNDMVLSMTVMWDFIAYGAVCEWRLFVRSFSFCTLSSEQILSSRFWHPWGFEELEKFHGFLGPQGYQLIVVEPSKCLIVFKEAKYNNTPHVISLVKHQDHFDGLTSIPALINRSY